LDIPREIRPERNFPKDGMDAVILLHWKNDKANLFGWFYAMQRFY
jgi:hypothetical protein